LLFSWTSLPWQRDTHGRVFDFTKADLSSGMNLAERIVNAVRNYLRPIHGLVTMQPRWLVDVARATEELHLPTSSSEAYQVSCDKYLTWCREEDASLSPGNGWDRIKAMAVPFLEGPIGHAMVNNIPVSVDGALVRSLTHSPSADCSNASMMPVSRESDPMHTFCRLSPTWGQCLRQYRTVVTNGEAYGNTKSVCSPN
jgi:hypothetical protein